MRYFPNSRLSRRSLLGLFASLPAMAQLPYKARLTVPPRYEGPDLDSVGSIAPGEVLIGYFGPDHPAHPLGGTMWMGASLAIEEANTRGGLHGAPFRLLSRWTDDPWRTGPSAIVKLSYEENICALVGGIDGVTTHLAEQVAAKALFPIVDPISTDETANHSGLPWIFSWAPGNRAIGRRMQAMLGDAPFLLVAGTDHDSRALAELFLKEGPHHPVLRIDMGAFTPPGVPRDADQVVVIASPACTVACVEALPARTRIVAGPSASSRLCRSIARRVETPALVEKDATLWKRLESRFGQPADAFAQLSFEATTDLIAVFRDVGPYREAIREALAVRMPPDGRREFAPSRSIQKETRK